MQPHANWASTHVRSWSGDIHVLDVVHAVGIWVGVLAFGIGAALAPVAEPLGARRRPAAGPAPYDAAAADEPLTAERRERVAAPDDRTAVR
jgi:hypothetical protein